MANTKLTTEELLIKEKVCNYMINSKELASLKQKYETYKNVDSTSTTKYGTTMASSNLPSSKIENMVMQKMIIEEQIKKITDEIIEVDYATAQLEGQQAEVVKLLLTEHKVTDVARILKIKRKKVDVLRKRAFANMYNSICKFRNTKWKNF